MESKGSIEHQASQGSGVR